MKTTILIQIAFLMTVISSFAFAEDFSTEDSLQLVRLIPGEITAARVAAGDSQIELTQVECDVILIANLHRRALGCSVVNRSSGKKYILGRPEQARPLLGILEKYKASRRLLNPGMSDSSYSLSIERVVCEFEQDRDPKCSI